MDKPKSSKMQSDKSKTAPPLEIIRNEQENESYKVGAFLGKVSGQHPSAAHPTITVAANFFGRFNQLRSSECLYR